MSKIPQLLNITEDDVRHMLACGVHLGSENVSSTMIRYVWKRNDDGVHIIDLRKTWEKLQLAARVIVAMNNPYDVCAVALTTGRSKQNPLAQRAVLKFSQLTGSRHIAGRYTPGTFTNRIQSNFCEPRLLVAADPMKDFQPILESSYVNMPVIAMADVDCPTRHIDIIIPCNTKSKYSVALTWWMLAREVLRLKGEIPRISDWEIPVDMFCLENLKNRRNWNRERVIMINMLRICGRLLGTRMWSIRKLMNQRMRREIGLMKRIYLILLENLAVLSLGGVVIMKRKVVVGDWNRMKEIMKLLGVKLFLRI